MRACFQEEQDSFPQDVAPDQRAVKVDAEDWRHLGEFGSCDGPHGMIVA